MVVEKSLTKNFSIHSMEEKKLGQIQGRISRRSMVLYEELAEDRWFSISQYNKLSSTCISNMYILACMAVEKSLTKIYTSKYGRKENWTNTGKNKQKTSSQSHETTNHHQPAYKI